MATGQTHPVTITMTGGIQCTVDLPDDLVAYLENYVTDQFAWQSLMEVGAYASIPVVDPLHKSRFAQKRVALERGRDPLDQRNFDPPIPQPVVHAMNVRLDSSLDPLDIRLNEFVRQLTLRLASLEDAAKTRTANEAVAAPPRTDYRSRNTERLVRAYEILSGENVRAHLFADGDAGETQEVTIDLLVPPL